MKSISRLVAIALASVLSLSAVVPNIAYANDTPSLESTTRSSSAGEEAVGDLLLQAMSLLGVAYRFGGNSPTTGLDCSGFIQYIFKKSLRVHLPRTAAEMARVGKSIDKSELNPGDLVFFNTRGFRYSHVGIYIGNNKFIHAPRTGKNIQIANMGINYWQSRYNGARRVVRGEKAVASNESERERHENNGISKFAESSNAHMAAGAAALVGSAAVAKSIHSKTAKKSSNHAVAKSNTKKKNAHEANRNRSHSQSSTRKKALTKKEKRAEAKRLAQSSRSQKNQRKPAVSSKKKASEHKTKARSTKHKKS